MSSHTMMRAAVFDAPGRLSLESRLVPHLHAPDDVLIRIDACGVCGSDLQILAVPPGHPARPGVILGHEICGRVMDAGPEARLDDSGGLVVVDPDVKCGRCSACQRGRPSLCRNLIAMGVDADGGFAAYCTVPARNVLPIAGSVAPAVATLVEPLATVLHGVRTIAPRLGESAVVFGGGPIGCLFLKALTASGVKPVWIVDPVPARRAGAEALGATGTAASAEAFASALPEWGAGPPDIVVDAVGRCLEDAISVVADGGRILLFGISAAAQARVRQFTITSREIAILGTIAGSFTMPAAVQAVESGALDLSDLAIDEVELEQLPETIERLRGGALLKAVVRPDA